MAGCASCEVIGIPGVTGLVAVVLTPDVSCMVGVVDMASGMPSNSSRTSPVIMWSEK